MLGREITVGRYVGEGGREDSQNVAYIVQQPHYDGNNGLLMWEYGSRGGRESLDESDTHHGHHHGLLSVH